MASELFQQHNLKDRFLSEKYTPEFLRTALLEREAWHPYPTVEDRAAWENLPSAVHLAHIAQGEQVQQEPWPLMPASLYLQYARVGNRRNFELEHFQRRNILAKLVVAECMEGQGRFLDSIVDAIWGICEESSWCLPAHIAHQKAGVGLADTAEPVLDLFAGETSALLAWTDYLIGARLDTVSPLVRPRIQREINERILKTALERDDYVWMGFKRLPVNNWNPWVNSNWLTSALLIEVDPQRRQAAVWKILESLDLFVTPYPQDGGCDEGPGYWGRAGASLFDNLDLLYSVSGGKMDVYGDPKVEEIGRFVYRAHIHDEYYVNFADAPARLVPDPLLVFRYGKAIGDDKMMNFGAWLAQEKKILAEGVSREGDVAPSLGRLLPALFNLNDLATVKAVPPMVRDVWLPDIEVLAARDQAGSSQGLYLAAKGGHNAESHNHNDIGHFIVYRDGLPVIIDAGVETYTRKTFSPQRYEIWTMQSAYHSLPTIDGVMQLPGREYAAQDVHYEVSEESACLDLNIASAYPPEAGLVSWQRQVKLVRGKQVEVVDAWKLSNPAKEITFSLVTACQVAQGAPGTLLLRPASLAHGRPSGVGQVTYDPKRFTVTTSEIKIGDERLLSVWGSRLTRIELHLANPKLEDQVSVLIS